MNSQKRGRFSAAGFLQNMPFRRKLMIMCVMLTSIPITALGLFFVSEANKMMLLQFESEQERGARQIAAGLENRLKMDDQFIRFTALSPYLMEDFNGRRQYDWFVISQKLNHYFEPTSWYYLILNKDFKRMRVYFEYLNTPVGAFIEPGANVAGESWYQEAKGIKQTYWFFSGGRLYACRRIYHAGISMFIGAVYMEMDTDRIFGGLLQGESDGRRILLTGSGGELLYGSALTPGGRHYVTTVGVDGFGWQLSLVSPTDDYNKNTGNILTFAVTLIALSVCLDAVLCWFLSCALTRPLQKLGSQIAAAESGDYDIIVRSDAKDEFGALTNSLGDMIKRTKAYIGQIVANERALREEELKSLQMQISPHFLYNLLSYINWKAYERDDNDISEIAQMAAAFYRTCLNRGTPMTTVRNELENIKAYIT